jgi:hypothetical protein
MTGISRQRAIEPLATGGAGLSMTTLLSAEAQTTVVVRAAAMRG